MKNIFIVLFFLPILCIAETFEYELDSLDSKSLYKEMKLFNYERELINENLFWDTRTLKTSNEAFSIACKAKRHIGTIQPLSASCIVKFDFNLSDDEETKIGKGKFEKSVLAQINNLSDGITIMENFGFLSTIKTEEQVIAELPNGARQLRPTFYLNCKKENGDFGAKCTALVIPR